MKKVDRYEIQKEYSKLIDGENFNPVYESHGCMTECNFGGLLITLDNSGESCVIVRDWSSDFVMISEILEIEYRETKEDTDWLAGFELDGEFYSLDNFMRI